MRWKRSNQRTDSSDAHSSPAQLSADSDTVDHLYRRYVRMVHGYLRANGAADADDLTSEVFVSMVRSLHTFHGDEEQFRSWLMTIAHRRLVDYRRRKGRVNVESFSDVSSVEREFARLNQLSADRSEFLDPSLIDGLIDLTPEQREVLALRFLADISLDEVARITGRPVGAVKSMQRRALETLRRSMAGLEEWRVG